MGLENYILWSEIGSRFGETGGTLQSLIPRSTPPEKPVEKSDRLLPRAAVPAWEKTGLGSLAWKAH